MKKINKKTFVAITAACMAMAVSVTSLPVSAENEKKTESTSDFKESGKIWIAGDSIASDHDIDEANEVQITGWGNVLQQFVSKNVTILNKARSGRSSKSYTNEKDYKEIIKGVGEGDYVIIQFGHNDEKSAPLYTDPSGSSSTDGSFKFYLKTKYIDPIYEKGGKVIFATSVVRHLFDGDKLSEQTHGVYAEAMKELAEECKAEGKEVYVIDTYGITGDIYNRLGEEKTEKLHAVIGNGSDAKLDETHYSPYGAVYMANIIAQQLKEIGVSCAFDVKKAWLIEDDSEKIEETRASIDKFSWR